MDAPQVSLRVAAEQTSTLGKQPGGRSRAALARRNRVLAHLKPILDIERDKNQAASAGGAQRDWSAYDTRLLVIAALDAIACERVFYVDGGVPREQVLTAIAAEAARCAPERPPDEHREVAQWILDRLLNSQAAARGFAVPFTDPSNGYRRGDIPVTVLYEDVASDGASILVFAADAAINLLLVTIDFELEDAQVAADAVLRVQVESGRWGDAVLTSERALLLSRSYRDQLQTRLAAVRRDLRHVDWEGAVEPILARANTHLGDRIEAEQALFNLALHSSNSDDDLGIRRDAARVVGILRDAISTLTRLLQDVMGARDQFRAAQLAQAFRPPAPVGAVELEAHVLEPFARLPAALAGSFATELCAAFGGPRVGCVMSLGQTLDLLLEPPRTAVTEPSVPDAGELSPLAPRFARFSDEDWALARERMGGVTSAPARLSELIAGLEHDPALLVCLLVLRAYTADGRAVRADERVDGLAVHADGVDLVHPTLLGPDLWVQRAAPRGGAGGRDGSP